MKVLNSKKQDNIIDTILDLNYVICNLKDSDTVLKLVSLVNNVTEQILDKKHLALLYDIK